MPTQMKSVVTGENEIVAKYYYKNPVKFANTASVLMMANSLPLIVEDIYAFLRRFILVKSKRTVKKVIPNLAQRIIEEEKEGVWQDIIYAIQLFKKYNFAFPEHEGWAQDIIVPMKKALISRMNVGEFIIALEPRPGVSIELRSLYEVYREYTNSTKAKCPPYKKFVEKIISVVQTDDSIYGHEWKKDFERVGMEEGIFIAYRNGQAEVLGNMAFNPPKNLRARPIRTLSLDKVVHEFRGPIGRFHSVRFPNASSQEILERLRRFDLEHKEMRREEEEMDTDDILQGVIV